MHTLRVPALRERLSDIPVLVEYLLRSLASQLRMKPKTMAPEALTLLAEYDWRKNNVRELRNVLERAVIDARPPHVEYRLTRRGRQLRSLVNALSRFAETGAATG